MSVQFVSRSCFVRVLAKFSLVGLSRFILTLSGMLGPLLCSTTDTVAQGTTYTGNSGFSFRPLDFDGDRKSDILWRHDDGTVAIWEMNGNTVKASLGVSTVPNDWRIVGTGNF